MKKRRAWKWVLGILALFALALGAILWSAHSRATAVFDRHDRLVKDAFAAIRARPSGRPALYEPAIRDNAWPIYLSAITGMKAIPAEEADEIPAIREEPEFRPDREKLAEIFEKHASLVEELRKSAQHEMFFPKYAYEDGLTGDLPNISQTIRSAKYLSGLAEFLHEEGRDGQALEALLLGIAMGQDTGRSGSILNNLIMVVCEGIETWMVREILGGHSLQAADLESFARKLDRLSEVRPSVGDAFVVEDAIIRRTLVDFGRSGADPSSLGLSRYERSWRYLFSRRLAYAGALGELEQIFRDARAVSGEAIHLRSETMQKVSDRALATKNPVVAWLYPALSKIYDRDAVSQMSWTLMRVAIAIAWHESERGRVPERLDDLVPRYIPRVPPCPLTGLPLGYRDGSVWSAGKNRVDDGGTPGQDNSEDDEDGDVVWRVIRE